MSRPRGRFVRWLAFILISLGLVGIAARNRDRLTALWRSRTLTKIDEAAKPQIQDARF